MIKSAIILGVLSFLDIILTRLVLHYGGFELNPLMQPIIETPLGAGLKLLITIALAYYLVWRNSKIGFIVANGFMSIVVINNLIALMIQINI